MRRPSLALLACGLGAVLSAPAATLTTAAFSSGLEGWTNNIDPTKWVASTQAVRVSFAPGILPQNAALEAVA